MKKFREMKKDNKGFSLVELIVVIAIMVVLVAVLGSTILGYVDKSKHSKDMQALDSLKTAVSTYVADPGSDYPDSMEVTLTQLMSNASITIGTYTGTPDKNLVISSVLTEVFKDIKTDGETACTFNNDSSAFKDVDSDDVMIWIEKGAVSIWVDSKDDDYADYKVGTHEFAGEKSADED